jgi:ABC-type multidrug transport system fused ATPase/permease subunit
MLEIDNLTRIIVTHRFNEAIIKKYDEIYVMSRGTVVERGTFDKLIENKGYFYSLYNVSQQD